MSSLRCPSCSAPLPDHVPSCPACGLRLVGTDAHRLWEVDQSLAALGRERVQLLERLRHPEAAPAPAVRAPAVARAKPVRSWTMQQVLLAGGVALLLVAAIVFVAVAWERIGTVGQVAVLGVVTASGLLASRTLSRRALHASAEAVAVLTCGLAVVDAVAVQQFGLMGADRLSGGAYWLIGVPAVMAVALVGRVLVPRPYAYPVAVVLGAAAWPFALMAALDVAETGSSLVGSATWLVAVGAGLVAIRRVRTFVLVVGVCLASLWFMVGTLTGVSQLFVSDRSAEVLLALLACVGLVTGLVVLAWSPRVPRAARLVSAVLAQLLAVATVVGVVQHAGAWALVAASVAASGAAAVAIAGRRTWRAAVPGLHALAWGAGLVSLAEPDWSWRLAGLWLAAVSASALVAVLATHGGRREELATYAGTTAALAVAALVHQGGDVVRVVSLCAVVVVLTALAAWRRPHREELGLGASAVVAAGLGAAYAFDAHARSTLVLLAVVLAVAGVLALAYGALPRRGFVAVAGVLLTSAATWCLSADAGITAVEAYSLPLAVLALGAGLVRYVRVPGASSWTTVGPGLAAALLPSAVASVPDEGLLRPLLVLAAGVLVTGLGVRLRWQAPVVLGVTASVVVALAQLGPYAAAMPRWASLGIAGALLLAMGFRYEQRRRDAIAAAHWLAHLH